MKSFYKKFEKQNRSGQENSHTHNLGSDIRVVGPNFKKTSKI